MIAARTLQTMRQTPRLCNHAKRCNRMFHARGFPRLSSQMDSTSFAALIAGAGIITLAAVKKIDTEMKMNMIKLETSTKCDRRRVTRASDVVMLGPTAEPKTNILFPRLCNGMTFTGCGVRVKYHFVKVYAVGTYMDPIAMAAVKQESDEVIAKALVDPMYPRTIRIVMNRTLSMDKFTSAINEALEPRMGGQDLDKLEEFKKMNPPGKFSF